MPSKNIIPLLLVAGGAAVVLSSSGKKKRRPPVIGGDTPTPQHLIPESFSKVFEKEIRRNESEGIPYFEVQFSGVRVGDRSAITGHQVPEQEQVPGVLVPNSEESPVGKIFIPDEEKKAEARVPTTDADITIAPMIGDDDSRLAEIMDAKVIDKFVIPQGTPQGKISIPGPITDGVVANIFTRLRGTYGGTGYTDFVIRSPDVLLPDGSFLTIDSVRRFHQDTSDSDPEIMGGKSGFDFENFEIRYMTQPEPGTVTDRPYNGPQQTLYLALAKFPPGRGRDTEFESVIRIDIN